MRTIDELLAAVEGEARRAEFPIDTPVYERSGRDPMVPVLFAGSLTAPVCSVGRDLGKDEVAAAQPQIGAAGRLVRAGVYRAAGLGEPSKADKALPQALDHVLLTNLVPYKPPGNKAYPESVRKRFRPFLAELLAVHWNGGRVITLGTEAFQWFAPYAEPAPPRRSGNATTATRPNCPAPSRSRSRGPRHARRLCWPPCPTRRR